MSKLKTAIVVDSGSMIKYDEMKDVYVVPMAVIKCENKHDITFRDGKDINVKTMLKEMTEGTIYKTASPIMGECSDLLEKISDKYDEIYILSTPKCVSGTFQQWTLLASDYKNVYVYDTKAPALNIKWLVEEIVKIKNIDHEKVSALCNEFYKKTNIGLIVKDLKYAIRGGRVSTFKGKIATLLRLNIVLNLGNDGFYVAGKTSNIHKLYNIVATACHEQCGYTKNNIEKLCIYVNSVKNPKFKVDEIASLLKKGFNFKHVVFAEFPPVFAAHAGPNYVGYSIKVK